MNTQLNRMDAPFTQSDWEFELDRMVSPTAERLMEHLAKAPDPDCPAAQCLKRFLENGMAAA